MHRRHASPIFVFGIVLAACGGRIAQGASPSDDATAPASSPPTTFAPCGSGTCAANEECCVGGSRDGNEGDETAPLEQCVPSGTCNTGLLLDCWGTCSVGAVCCVTINPTTLYATAGCAASCGGNGLPAVQLCATDADCPLGDQCFTASIGPNGEGETTQVCGGVR